MPFDIVLVDDHKLVRDGVRTILERGAEFRVVGEAENGADAVQLCKKAAPDMVLMDIGLPGMNGIEATTELLRHCPGVKVVDYWNLLHTAVGNSQQIRKGTSGVSPTRLPESRHARSTC